MLFKVFKKASGNFQCIDYGIVYLAKTAYLRISSYKSSIKRRIVCNKYSVTEKFHKFRQNFVYCRCVLYHIVRYARKLCYFF